MYLRDHTMHGARRWRVKMLNRDGKNNIIYLIAETFQVPSRNTPRWPVRVNTGKGPERLKQDCTSHCLMREALTHLQNKEGNICRQYTTTGLKKHMKNTRKRNIYELNCVQIPGGGDLLAGNQENLLCVPDYVKPDWKPRASGTKLVTVDLGEKNVKAAGSTIDRILQENF